ncbi:hypothetical protein [Pulveribacter sp.]|uniref:hypothetical protein n=1 Tax=Pulveribacter sp. TaxID=2678893 RepID=UPI0028ACC760|nr:hypothetical protein [Pulveribacter sp.]
MNILLPIVVKPEMFGPGTTIPEVDTGVGEVAWEAGGTYGVGDRRIDAGYTYEVVKAPSTTEEKALRPSDPKASAFWLKDENAPSNRMAPFDSYLFTQARASGELTYVLRPGFVTGFAMHGVDANSFEFTYRDSPEGEVLVSQSGVLYEQAYGLWEYLFGDLQRDTKWTSPPLPLRPNGEITITLRQTLPTTEVSVGWLGVGQWQFISSPMSPSTTGAQYGIEVTPKSYSYYKGNPDGTYLRKPGRQAKVITGSAVVDAIQAPRIEALLRRAADTAVAVDFSALPKYRHLGTVGFLTGSVTNDRWNTARFDFKMEGNI